MGVFEEARACRLCHGVVAGTAAIGAGNGPVPCPVMFVGEAPGRLGAARTGVPFCGDVAGRRFEALLAEAGLGREEVFVTNAVLCLPADECGRNRRPRTSEIRACSAWLARTLDTVRPDLVVALGGVALDGLARIEPHGLALARDCGRPVAWHGLTVVALYHPGARAAVHRPWAAQVEDWRTIGALLRADPGRSWTRASACLAGAFGAETVRGAGALSRGRRGSHEPSDDSTVRFRAFSDSSTRGTNSRKNSA